MAIFDVVHEAGDVDHLVLPCQHLVSIVFKDAIDNLQHLTHILLEVAVVVDVQVPFDRQGMVDVEGSLD